MKNRTITLPKLKEIKIKGYRKTKEIKGRIINATVSRDLGVKDLVITSYGEKYNNQKYITKYEKKIKNLQKWLSKKQKGSKNYYKVKNKLKEAYKKLKNARKYLIYEITKK